MAVTMSNEHNSKMIAPNIIQTRALCKDFELGDQWVHALNTVDLDIPQGQFTAIMGPSGSGKSTLLYMLGGLDRPSEGEITVAANRLDTLSGEVS